MSMKGAASSSAAVRKPSATTRPSSSRRMKDLFSAYGKYTPGAKWTGAYNTDVATGVKAKNHILIYQDTYIMGKGYLPTTSLKVPEKYYTITKQ